MLAAARIILFVKDIDKMLAFYEGTLGLPRLISIDDSSDFVSLDAGGIALTLHTIPKRYAKNISISNPPTAREQVPVKVVFRSDKVGELRNELEAKEARMLKLQKWDSLCFCDGVDPEGNIFQISNRP